MAGEATIGALRVILGADTAKFEDNLKSAVSSLESFGKKIATIATGVGIERIFEKAFSAVVDSITGAIDAADKLAKASQKFGVPVETLSALSNAAALSDVSVEQLGSSLSRLSKNMIAASGPTSEQATAFAALGISVKDSSGQLKNADQILLAVADSFSKFRDGTTKTALAVAIFGRAGADLIPFLDQGASGIGKLTDEMKSLGIVIDGQTAKAAEKFNDDLKTLALAKDAIILRILGSSGMLDAMTQLSGQMIALAGESNKTASTIGDVLGKALRDATSALTDLNAGVQGTLRGLADLDAIEAAIQKHDFAAAWDAAKQAATDFGFRTAEAQKAVAALSSTTSPELASMANSLKAAAAAGKELSGAPPIFDPNAAKNLKAFNDELAKLHDKALDISGAFAGQLAPGFLAATANMEALKGQITIVNGEFVKLGPLAEKFNQAMLQVAGQQLIQSTLPAWQQFEQQIIKNTTALTAMGKTADEIAAINQKAAFNAGQSWEFAAQSITSSLAAGFAGFAAKNKEFAGIAKAAAIAEAIANTYLAATKALAAYPPPFGEIAAAASVVAGLGMVAKIQAQQFAKGGSFMVPGGRNSRDNVMVPLALSGGERVDITPSGQAGARGGGRVQQIDLTGLADDDRFTGKRLRMLFDSINQGTRDGYRIRLPER